MNFLAHFHLSRDQPDLLVGNFIADFLKGSSFGDLSPQVIKGVRLHRFIDSFTDQHPVFLRSKKLLYEYRHYSGVILDVFYDYCLATNWSVYHPLPLPQFAANVYGVLDERREELSEEANYALDHMIENNWLEAYATVEGINRSLVGLSERTTFKSGMEYAIKELVKNEDAFRADFEQFYPELQQVSSDYFNAL